MYQPSKRLVLSLLLLLLAPCLVATAQNETRKQAQKKNATRKNQQRRKPLLSIPEVDRKDVICFALYTVEDNILKLNAQLYPLKEGEPRKVRLEVKKAGDWKVIAETKVIARGWTAPFRVIDWDSTRDTAYRVAHAKTAYYEGLIRRDPVEKKEIVVAAFTGNSISPAHGGDISRDDIVQNIKRIKPDLLFFSGDQVYDHRHHYAAWLKFGRDFGEIIRSIPTITIPDDHDVGQANIWGANGKKASTGSGPDGGFFMPVEYVNEV
ncbi:MAG: metallophosphoesterase family protein, partial [Planctomycetota bacterium]